MSSVGIAIGVLCAISAVCAAVLVIAAKYMDVPVDMTVEKIRDCLPGANCGACGYAGCDNYASELASGNEEKTNKCLPGGDKTAKAIAAVLGTEADDVIEHVAVVRCQGSCENAIRKEEYQGISSCAGANLLFGGSKMCTFACLGYGDCAEVCPEHAIVIQDGLARIDAHRCIGCGRCAETCPNHIIALVPDTVRTVVACSNTLSGAVVRPACKVGCIGCKKCEKECPASAITVENSLSKIDYGKCTNCGHCVEICPTKAITEADRTSALNYSQAG